ncbi:hypothetical protein EMPS_09603 [Entomortierella parvispora]|uniref:Uncharacterized protein n=1 Tax=Entomortierella parvispora TaxID=205924 RepID=A0A9P3M0F4_9FUNG|nr:hypothetical protein EMPS_09603 [Entomortierella parvispora]
MARLHPLDLPEIRNHLALFLPRHELTVCARLSHVWYYSLLPYIWSELRIVPVGSFCSKNIPPLALARGSSCIQKLDYIGKPKTHLGSLHCPKLKHLTLHWYDQFVLDFIRRHRITLKGLTFAVIKDQDENKQNNHEFWETAMSCPRLESLSVSGVHITRQDLPHFWGLWSQLTFLKLSMLDIHLPGLEESSGAVFTRIKELELDGVGGRTQLQLLAWCPELVSLIWRRPFHHVSDSFSSDLKSIGNLLSDYTQYCPKLIRLTVEVNATSADDEILPFLKSRSNAPIERLSLKKNWFGEATWSHLQQSHHRHKLKILELKGVRGKMVQEILCSLPNLTSISAPWIQDIDMIEDPRPWVCLGLTRWSICIDLVQKETSQRMVFERLGTLQSLETLDLAKVESRGKNHRPLGNVQFLSFGLDHGLDSLRNLRKLNCLSLLETPQEMDAEDLYWMLENWPRLGHLYGTLHPDGLMGQTLRGILVAGMVLPRIDCGVSVS